MVKKLCNHIGGSNFSSILSSLLNNNEFFSTKIISFINIIISIVFFFISCIIIFNLNEKKNIGKDFINGLPKTLYETYNISTIVFISILLFFLVIEFLKYILRIFDINVNNSQSTSINFNFINNIFTNIESIFIKPLNTVITFLIIVSYYSIVKKLPIIEHITLILNIILFIIIFLFSLTYIFKNIKNREPIRNNLMQFIVSIIISMMSFSLIIIILFKIVNWSKNSENFFIKLLVLILYFAFVIIINILYLYYYLVIKTEVNTIEEYIKSLSLNPMSINIANKVTNLFNKIFHV